MTEPELIEVLAKRFRVQRVMLENVSDPEFPQRLTKIIGKDTALLLLIDLFNGSVIAEKKMCEVEKAIIREIRSWQGMTPEFRIMANHFMETELQPDPRQSI